MAIDNPDDRKLGPASAAAHAEAAKKVGGFARELQAADRIVQQRLDTQDREPERGDSQDVEDDEPTDDREDGPSPSPTPEDDDADVTEDEDEISDDYDEEDHVEEAEDEDESEDRSKTKVKADAPKDSPDDEVERTWNQYKTDAERKKAFAENKRYAIEMANKAKELEAKIAQPADDKAPATTEAPKTEDREAIVRRLMVEREDVRQEIDQLRIQREAIDKKVEERAQVQKDRDAAEKSRTKLLTNIEYLENRYKADPENYALGEEIEGMKRQAERLEVAIDKHDTRDTRLDIEVTHLQSKYREGSTRVQGHIIAEERSISEKASTEARRNQERAATETLWNETVPKVAEACKIPKESRDDFEEDLLVLADSVLNRGNIKDVSAWMMEQGKRIAAKYARARAAGTVVYVEQKKRDAEQPAPTGSKAVAKRPKTQRYDSRTADREAQAAMRRHLSR